LIGLIGNLSWGDSTPPVFDTEFEVLTVNILFHIIELSNNVKANMQETNLVKVSVNILEAVVEILEISDRTFKQEVMGSDLPVIVDFWADWCAPCKIIAPILTQLAEEYSGKIKIVKLNIEENSETPRQHCIRSIPTLMIFKHGQKVDTIVGALPRADIVKAIERYC
jgi:thioredoxin 1